MKNNIAFIHQTFPGQFGPVIQHLLQNFPDTQVSFFAESASPFAKPINHPRFQLFPFKSVKTGHEENPYFFSRYFEQECASAHGVYNALKQSRITPDVLLGHISFGTLSLLHAEYADIPRIGFFELFYNTKDKQSDRSSSYPVPKANQLRIPMRNATHLLELEYCTKGYCPTSYQKSTFPERYQDKLDVLFDGIDTDFYCPGEVGSDSELNRTWPADAKIVTYVARGLEAMRGFDIFMEIAHRICQQRSDVHFVIAGNPKTHYGSEMISVKEPTFKEHVLKKHPFDLNRFHFMDWVSEPALRDLFRLSDCHFYWTVPFVLSWSLFQALSTGVLAVTSDSAPVRDIIFHEQTGLMMPPHDIDGWVEQILEVLDKPDQFKPVREGTRALMVERFSFYKCLPKLAEFYFSGTTTFNALTTKQHAEIR